ncbi:MAG: hypothetical protein R2764_01665 [Bacteroidales bacterium]
MQKQPFHFRILKARIAETLIKELFKLNGYNVFNFGMEQVLPGITGSLNTNTSEEAQIIRQLPDFVIQNTSDGSLQYVEVKYRNKGNFKFADLPKDFKYTNAVFIIVHKTGIGCISYNQLKEIGKLPLNGPYTIDNQNYFQLSEDSVQEFMNYARMLFAGVA